MAIKITSIHLEVKVIYIKFLSAIALIVSIVWVIIDPGFQSVLAVVTSISAMIASFIIEKRKAQHDKQPTYEQIIDARGSYLTNVIQTISNVVIKPRTVIVAIVIIAATVILTALIFNVGPLREMLPTPMQFEPANEGESLIIIADFENRSDGEHQGVDPAQYIYEKLVEQAQADDLDIRIERLREVVDDNTVRSIGEKYKATMVLWGWFDALTITPRIERIHIRSKHYSSEEGMHLSLTDPTNIEFSIVHNLPAQTTYLTFFILGLDEFTMGFYDTALKYFNGAFEAISQRIGFSIDPIELYYFRGVTYLLKTNTEMALNDFNMAIELTPENATFYHIRGFTYVLIGDCENGIADFSKAVNLDPELFDAYINRGNTFNLMGNHEDALADFSQALELNPDESDAYRSRGTTYAYMGEYESALVDYSQALALNPGNALVFCDRGGTYSLLGEYASAFSDYDQALALNPEFTRVYYNRGCTYNQLGDFEHALADYSIVLNLNPDYTDAYINRGRIYSIIGEYESALADFSQALEMDIGLTRARNYYKLTNNDMEDFERISAEYSLTLNPSPEFADAYQGYNLARVYSLRGVTYSQMKDFENALLDYSQALELNPEYADAYYNRGLTYIDVGEFENALADFSKAIELNSKAGDAFINRGWTYYLMGEYMNSIADFSQALELNPYYAQAYVNRGLAYELLGQEEQAITDFECFLVLTDNRLLIPIVEEKIRELRQGR